MATRRRAFIRASPPCTLDCRGAADHFAATQDARSTGMKKQSVILRLATTIVLALILGPILIIVLYSFSSAESLVFPPPGLTLRWFHEFFVIAEMRSAFILSLVLALVAASASGVLGLLGAVYVSRRTGAWVNVLQTLFMAPLVFPTVILGLALLLLYRQLGIGTLPGLLIGHVVVCLPYAFRSVLSVLQSFDTALEEAGQSLGAGPMRSFLLITVPIIWPGILSAWLFGFIVSFGELNAALFLTGPGVTTLPIETFSYLQFQGSQLVVAAASTIQVLMIIVLLTVAAKFVGVKRVVQR
ncbi:ABC transporter permease [Paraburkholderia sp. DGU8]|uniref:ABC transporter permease n=1 Tax=Paraburkholderia sp. DGU8 TaxID=3161997 RepID=UPI00346625DA